MSTNYYFEFEDNHCEKCGRKKERIHIGTSCHGWVFFLHYEEEYNLTDWPEWLLFLIFKEGKIVDEYGNIIPLDEMIEIICDRKMDNPIKKDKEFLAQNFAVEGPKGLMRTDPRATDLVKHGEGTWDVIKGDFR